MYKISIFSVVFFSAVAFAQDGAPATPYYDNFNFNQTGVPLRNALATKVIATHTNELTYAQVENAIRIIDLDPNDSSNDNVFLVYGFSDNICPSATLDSDDHRKRDKEADGTSSSCEWNREHTFAKSLGNPDLGTDGPGADAHHIRASDVDRNSDRGNEKFAAGSGNSGDVTGSTWYPGDEWKGDIARMMMYMYLRYGDRCLPSYVAVGTINSVDSNMINLLLEWNAEDPVSGVEDQRNTYLGDAGNNYGQGNRNPFIDNPYLATLIWGGPVAENRWPFVLAMENHDWLANVSLYPNPANEHKITITSMVALDTVQLLTINGQIVRQMKNPISHDNNYTLENLPHGFYFLRLESRGQSITRKIVVH